MNKPFLFFFAFIFIIGCKTKRSSFEIKGKIVHATGQSILLKQLFVGNRNPVIIDTAPISANGDLSIKTFLPLDPSILILSIDKGPDLYLINDAPSIEVQLDVLQYKSYKTEGSPASNQLHQFLESYGKNYERFFQKLKLYDTMLQTKVSDSVLWQCQKEKNEALVEVNKLIITNLKNTDNPALQSYLLARAFATMEKIELSKLIGSIREKSKNYAPFSFLFQIIQQELKKDVPYALINKKAPNFSLLDTGWRPMGLDSLRGKYVLLNFWSSTSATSRSEHPILIKAYHNYRNHGFEILGIAFDSTRKSWKRTIQNDDIQYWKNVIDDQQSKSTLYAKYAIDSLPFNVLIDTSGKIIASNLHGRSLGLKLYETLLINK